MTRSTVFALLSMVLYGTSAVQADSFGSGANTFGIEFVTIGDPGNPADTTGNPSPAGSVLYSYRIGKYAVSRDMVAKANAEGGLEISLDPMSRVAGGPRPDMPASGVSWNEAARFVNWLNTSQGFHPAYKFSTQPGDADYDANQDSLLWTVDNAGYDPNNMFRNSMAHYFLPNTDEWYKAAYYDPVAGVYYDYPMGSSDAPTPVSSGTTMGTAVFSQRDGSPGPADITQAGGLSPYGVMGMGGNVWEYEESSLHLMNDDPSSLRGIRGGDWFNFASFLISSHRSGSIANGSGPNFVSQGFRVASVIPEPSSAVLGLLAGMGLLVRRGPTWHAKRA